MMGHIAVACIDTDHHFQFQSKIKAPLWVRVINESQQDPVIKYGKKLEGKKK